MARPERYTCEETFQRLDDYLDRELTPKEMDLVRKHLAVCEICAREFSFEGRFVEDMKEKLRHLSAPSHLRQRVTRALRASASLPGQK